MSKMQSFVRRGSPAPGALQPGVLQPGINENTNRLNPADLKQPLPKTKSGKFGNHSGARGNLARKASNADLQHVNTEQQNEPYDPYDTEVGSVADTTTDFNQIFGEQVNNRQQVFEISDGADEDEHHTNDDYDDSDGEADDDDDVLEYERFGQKFIVSKRTEPDEYASIKARIERIHAPQFDDGSYPDTTSGSPSTVAPEQSYIPEQRPGSRLAVRPLVAEPYATNGQQDKVLHPSWPAPRAGVLTQGASPSRDHVSFQPVSLPEVHQNQQSSYYGAPQSHPDLGPHEESQAPLRRARDEQTHHQNKSGVKRTVAVDNGRRGATSRQHDTSSKDVEASLLTPTKTPKSMTVPVMMTTHQRGQSDVFEVQGVLHGHQLDHVKFPDEGEGSHDFKLDYDEKALFQRDFSELQAEKYDLDPRSRLNDQNELTGDVLHQKLDGLVKAEPRQQRDFFASLGIEQWEEAGEWFLDQFSESLNKFREKRQEKRKLSREFEAQIASRYEEVRNKRKATDNALAAMRGAGAHVLDTPKKMKQ
ncbi:extracellular mutant protein 11-domain-containing protein [Delphinella strobiligena]|nr:extracellular mutant protein 11-domain-containing protein [Delphinella strobiligena]